eukprot:2852544-Pleurochrysis_carterae.AAC.1
MSRFAGVSIIRQSATRACEAAWIACSKGSLGRKCVRVTAKVPTSERWASLRVRRERPKSLRERCYFSKQRRDRGNSAG